MTLRGLPPIVRGMGQRLGQAIEAIERGAPDAALELLPPELDLEQRLLVAAVFRRAGHFAHAFHVLAAAAVLALDAAAKGQCDGLVTETLLAWGAAIEAEGFPAEALARFSRAVDACAGPPLSHPHLTLLVGLDEGLQRRRPVTAAFASMISAR